MKTRRQDVSEDALTISRQSSTSIDRRENSEAIPTDLIFEILLKLPAKSIARCRCVSKLWSSILVRPDFTELFLTRSSTLPQLLFSFEKNSELFFFTAPRIQNPDENSSLVSPSYHTKVPIDRSSQICGHVRGLLCLTHLRVLKGRKETVPMICNPNTGQALPLPKVKTRRVKVRSFLVYDPIEKQFKVLSMTWPCYGNDDKNCKEYQILTLGTQTLSWRMIDCCLPHHPAHDGICIDGCLYYQAMVGPLSGISTIVCFDVRSEKFNFVKKARGMALYGQSALVNYEGRLGAIQSDGLHIAGIINSQTRSLELWVLVDAEKHEWSRHVYVLPPMWKNVVAEAELNIVGRTSTNEIVLSRHYSSVAFYLFYYNPERNTVRRVEIQGMDEFKHSRVHTFLDHVEDVKLMHYNL
ncbi:F-box associated domain type 3 [Arabidopsis thaliana x Arabidopsis arenosa]|uniref:F-box associated domain type 3 n=1 Tax=Arabidopsis thaliana x Arabidopsis arenosa TaxID=1240361 RepID=A0A8T2A526_9BRAS|nr:F-box associated domain type 3 [Arabidopsis thaliana x Arabidopsis arenosa]